MPGICEHHGARLCSQNPRTSVLAIWASFNVVSGYIASRSKGKGVASVRRARELVLVVGVGEKRLAGVGWDGPCEAPEC